jgi:hypothetical protein
MINAHKGQRWIVDLSAARDATDEWYMRSGRLAYETARRATVDEVTEVLRATDDLRRIEPDLLRQSPAALTTLRMSTAPPVARDRLAGLSRTERPLLTALEQDRLPSRLSASELDAQLSRVCAVLAQMLDRDLFDWLEQDRPAEDPERTFAATLIADRRCESVGESILRQAERERQARALARWLDARGYTEHVGSVSDLQAGGYRLGPVGLDAASTLGERTVDAVIRPRDPRGHTHQIVLRSVPRAVGSVGFSPVGLSAAATGARSDETTVLLLVGVADQRFLRQGAAAGLDWIWEHRLDDLALVGL